MNMPPEPEDLPLVYDPTPPAVMDNIPSEQEPEWNNSNETINYDPLDKFYNTNIPKMNTGDTNDILNMFSMNAFPELDGSLKRIFEIKADFYKYLTMNFHSENIINDEEIKIHTEKIDKTLEMIDHLFQEFHKIQIDASQSEIKFNETLKKANHDIHKIQDFQDFIHTIHQKYNDLDSEKIESSIKDVCEKLLSDSLVGNIKKDYEKKLYLFKYYLHHFIKKVNHSNTGVTCSICLQKPVDTFLNPCGHTGCLECINLHKESFTNTGLNPCFICRKEIKSEHKIYFS